jgi:hypothetical protein
MSGCQVERPGRITGTSAGRCIDSREVADAIVRSWMLVAGEPGYGAVRAEKDEPAAR